MAGEIASLRNKARIVKDLALTQAADILGKEGFVCSKCGVEGQVKVPKEKYWETFQTVLKNAVPRSQEISGEDGQPITITFDKVFNESNETLAS